MPLQYIIDAYNLINHTAFIPIRKKIKDPHRALLEFLKEKMPGERARGRITVVFDGYPVVSAREAAGPGIKVIFSCEDTADAIIKGMAESSKNPRDIVVASDDREVRFFVKSCGGRPVGVEEFIHPRGKPQKKKEDLIKTELNYSQVSRINQELKALWLKD